MNALHARRSPRSFFECNADQSDPRSFFECNADQSEAGAGAPSFKANSKTIASSQPLVL